MGFAAHANKEQCVIRRLGRGKEVGVEPLWAPRVYPATNLVFALNSRASRASFVDTSGIDRQDWTAFSTNDLELCTERKGVVQRQKNSTIVGLGISGAKLGKKKFHEMKRSERPPPDTCIGPNRRTGFLLEDQAQTQTQYKRERYVEKG